MISTLLRCGGLSWREGRTAMISEAHLAEIVARAHEYADSEELVAGYYCDDVDDLVAALADTKAQTRIVLDGIEMCRGDVGVLEAKVEMLRGVLNGWLEWRLANFPQAAVNQANATVAALKETA